MEASGTCDIARLPEELLSAALVLTTPRPTPTPSGPPAPRTPAARRRELSAPPPPSSEKGRFLRLCDRPVLLADGLTSMWLDRESGARCFMLSARKLNIAWGDTPRYWSWIPIQGFSFSEAAQLLHVWWLEICGKIHSKMLSRNSAYAAYMVFKVAHGAYGLCLPYPEASVTLGETKSTCHGCLDEDGDPWCLEWSSGIGGNEIPVNVLYPRERADGWMELEMGDFQNDEGEDGEISIKLRETAATVKSGLIVQGIEIRSEIIELVVEIESISASEQVDSESNLEI